MVLSQDPQISCWELLVAATLPICLESVHSSHSLGVFWFSPTPSSQIPCWELVVTGQSWTGSDIKTGLGLELDWVSLKWDWVQQVKAIAKGNLKSKKSHKIGGQRLNIQNLLE